MKVYEFGKKSAPALLLLPGTCCHWKGNFGRVIPLLEKDFRVLCVSYDAEYSKILFQQRKRIFEYSASAMTALMRRKTQSFRPCLRKQRK